ncbi:MAG TPA: DEAD/DEAH box helicase, partial [Nitrospira sp.]|nr:DEAD/DEAH box helicase [Nitrospira sp.]
MTTHELEQLLLQQPVSLLHRLARGRISRHFRSGKRKLIDLLLQASAENRPGLESDLAALIEEQSHRRQAAPVEQAPKPKVHPRPAAASTTPRPHRAEEHGHHEPPVSLHEWLSGIGVPQAQPFVPDAWQVDALARLAETDVVVSVPTGSGKTYVAIEATKRAMQENRTVIYTSPLKALSNTKFTEFSRLFGPGQVGILTGDRREHAQAPLLIMTTEILRNLLYDAAGGEIDVRLDTLGLVIMDESQYLADPERGVV